MRAARREDLWRAALAAEQHGVFTQDAQRLDLARLDIVSVKDRVPEPPHVAAVDRAGSDPFDIGQRDLAMYGCGLVDRGWAMFASLHLHDVLQ